MFLTCQLYGYCGVMMTMTDIITIVVLLLLILALLSSLF